MINLFNTIPILILALCIRVDSSVVADRVDLFSLLARPATLSKLIIEYQPSTGSFIFIYGTGNVVRQVHKATASSMQVPTCSGTVTQNEVKVLVRELIRIHFFALPSRSYIFQTASNDEDEFWQAVQLHSITIDDGGIRASRQFASGFYGGRKQTIPSAFAVAEAKLRKIADAATNGKPCSIAPAVKLTPIRPS